MFANSQKKKSISNSFLFLLLKMRSFILISCSSSSPSGANLCGSIFCLSAIVLMKWGCMLRHGLDDFNLFGFVVLENPIIVEEVRLIVCSCDLRSFNSCRFCASRSHARRPWSCSWLGHDERLRGAMVCLFLGTEREIYQLLRDEKLALRTIGESFFSFPKKIRMEKWN